MILRNLADIEHLERTPLAAHDLPQNTYAALQRSAQRSPEAPALSFFFDAEHYQQAWHWSHAELFARITRTANALHALGVGPDDVVALVLPNLPETHFCTWGVSERASHLAGGYPVVRQQLGQGAGLLRRQAHEHILQVGVRIVSVQAG
jgi:non-ribosomal peptide synthetase component F